MATTTQSPSVTGKAAEPKAPEQGAGRRLTSLDAYRGFIMLLLVSE